MAGNATVKVFFVGDAKQLQGVMSDVAKDTETVEKAAKKSEKGFSDLQAALIGFGVGAGLKKVIGDASDLNETVSKTQTIFGSASKSVLEWSEGAAKGFGLSKNEALSAASTFGNMFDQLGIGMGVAKDMSTQMVQLASDFASFHNADTTDVIDAMTSAFRGEYDALQRFVPTINAAAVEQKALEMGLAATTKELDAQDKAIATQALIMENAGEAAGDFARTSDSLANKQRIMKAELANVSAELGTNLMPIATQVVGVITKMAEVFGALPAPLQQAVLGIGALTAGIVLTGKAAEHLSSVKEAFQSVVGMIDKMRGSQEAATVATQAATAAEVANTAATEANTAAHAAGASAFGVAAGALGALALAGAAVYGTYQMMHDAMVTVDVDTQQMARNTNDQLVKAWQWASENAQKFNLDLDDFAAKVATNIGVATRMADALDAQGLSSEKLRAAIQAELEAEQRSADTKEVAKKATQDAAEAAKEYAANSKELDERLKHSVITIKDYTGAINGQQKAAIDSSKAQGDFAEAITTLTQAVKTNGTNLDVWTAKGREVRGALDGLIIKGGEWLDAIRQQYGAGAQWAAAHVEMRNQIIASMRQLGFGVEAINEYIRAWLQSVRQMAYVVDGWKTYGDELDRYEGRLTDSIEEKWGALPPFFKNNSVESMDAYINGVITKSPGIVKAMSDVGADGGKALADGVKDGVEEAKKALDAYLKYLDSIPPISGAPIGEGPVVTPEPTYAASSIGSGELLRGSSSNSLTVIVNSPVVQNPVTANSLAYSISRQAAVAFAGAA